MRRFFSATGPIDSPLRSAIALVTLLFVVCAPDAFAGVPSPAAARSRDYAPPVQMGLWGGCLPEERGPLGACWGSDEPSEFRFPEAVTIDDEGSVYVAEPWNDRTQKFSPDGALLDIWTFGAPVDLRWGPGDVLWAIFEGRVQTWDRDGNRLSEWGQSGSGPGEFRVPRALDFDADGNVLVLDAGNARVQRLTQDGAYLGEWPLAHTWWGGANYLAILALPDGSVLVSEEFDGFTQYAADGTALGKWAPPGSGPGQFRKVRGMALGADGYVYLVDSGNDRIQVMTPAGEYIGQWGGRGVVGERLWTPYRIAVGGNFVYVVDTGNSAVHAYSYRSVVTTDPPGQPVLVDGAESVSPVVVDWTPGTQHQIEAIALQEADGRRCEFAGWSDGGSLVHAVTTPEKPAAYTAAYDTYFWMEMTGDAGATITPGSRWVPADEPVEVHGSAPDGYAVRWIGSGRGSYSGSLATGEVRAREPVTEHAVIEMSGSFVTLTISASDADPFAQTDAPAGGVRQLHLWVTCAAEGLGAFEARTVGSLTPVAFVPAEGVVNAGTAEHLFLGIGGCPTGPNVQRRIGTWYVNDAGGDLCLGETAEGIFAWATCDPVLPVVVADPELHGFSSSGAPCVVGSRGCPGPPAARFADTGAPSPALARAAVDVFGLAPPRPNPFRDRTTFLYTLPAPSDVRVSVFDVTGRLVRRLADGRLPGGAHAVDWDGRGGDSSPAPAGVYFVRLEANGRSETRKVTRLGVQ